MRPAWARQIRDRCVAHNVPFFFKQWGGVNKKAAGRKLEGREWNQVPKPLGLGMGLFEVANGKQQRQRAF